MKKTERYIRIVGYGSLGLVGIVVVALLFPNVTASLQAESCLDDPTIPGCYSAMTETEVGVKANTAISLAIDSSVEMEVTPKASGATSSTSTALAVSTNSSDGYALYVQAGSETGDLISTSSNVASMIKNTTKTNAILSELEKNSYGYALTEGAADATTKYSTVPTDGSIVKKTTSVTPTEGNYAYGDTYYLSFGVNIGTDIQAGTYTGNVIVSAVANPKTIATLFDLDYMQDMTKDVCTNTRTGYTKQLIDTRDGQKYWVTKLTGSSCWMVQNLALTITQNMIDSGSINSSNTDIDFVWGNTPAWTDESSWQSLSEKYTADNYPGIYIVPTPTAMAANAESINSVNTTSWNMGKLLLATPANPLSCEHNLDYNDDVAEVCGNAGVIDVSGKDWTPGYVAQNGAYIYPNGEEYVGLVTVDVKNKTYDEHYLVGNYYYWGAAVAGTGQRSAEYMTAGSLCPKGWGLPTHYNSGDSEYGTLLRNVSNFKDGALVRSDGKSIFNSPWYLIRGGFISPNNGTLEFSNMASSGYYWLRGASDKIWSNQSAAGGAWSFRVLSDRYEPISWYAPLDRNRGYSIRCVTK